MRQLTPKRRARGAPATRRARGLTLIELMVALAIGAVLLTAGTPFFSDYVNNARLREGGNLLLTEALLAQSEAVKRNSTIRLQAEGDTVKLLDMSGGGVGVAFRERRLPPGVSAGSAVAVDIGSEGRPAVFGSTGSIDLSHTSLSCSDELRCPGLRIDAGGATRLCANKSSCS